MDYYSLSDHSSSVDFRQATITGLAPDKGLYFPDHIPLLPKGFMGQIEGLSKEEIAFTVIEPYVGQTIPSAELQSIVSETVHFDFPLIQVDERSYSLELFHGPTLAFKDVGARFMSRCLGWFVRNQTRPITVLVATSGDTGGAVANGFYEVPGIQVVILYPAGKISLVQELQLTTPGKNITALQINGSFDDCQRMVKEAFSDRSLQQALFLTSANSINVARWLPQQFYYFFAWQQWKDKTNPPVISVPSGNFGNICAGLLAKISGLPVKHFIAACNANTVFPNYLVTGNYSPLPPVSTLSNAMDVGDPSNFVRVLELFQHQFHSIKDWLTSESISDEQTKATIAELYSTNGYLTDPHGAVGYTALHHYLKLHPESKGIFLETAHPIKFYDIVEPVIHSKISVPPAIESLYHKMKYSIQLEASYVQLKDYLLSTCR